MQCPWRPRLLGSQLSLPRIDETCQKGHPSPHGNLLYGPVAEEKPPECVASVGQVLAFDSLVIRALVKS